VHLKQQQKCRTQGLSAAVAATPMQRQRASEVKKTLYFGCRQQPKTLVVLLHGMNDSAKACADWAAPRWAAGLPGALLAVPQAPDRWCRSIGGEGDTKYAWFNTDGLYPWEAQRLFGQDSREFEASLRQYHGAIRDRCRQVESWLAKLLAKHRLTYSEVILAGVSQGSLLAAIIGARNGARGVALGGGVAFAGFLRLSELMPEQPMKTKFFAVNAAMDPTIERVPLEAMLKRCNCKWHWSKGLGNDLPEEWSKIKLAWMQSLLGKAAK